MSDIPMRRCTKCGEEKPETVEYFYWRKDREVFEAACKVCLCERNRQWYAKNTDKMRDYRSENAVRRRAQRRRWYAENTDKARDYQRQYYVENVDIRCEYNRQYHIKNRDNLRERAHQYRVENAGKERERGRRYRIGNPNKMREYQHRRRALEANADGSHTAADIRLQVAAQTNKRGQLICWWCDKVIKKTYHVDHRVPLAKGGSNNADNIVIAHKKCNLSKGAKMPYEWNGRLL